MSTRPIFPAEIAEDTAEVHFQRYNPRTVLVYQLVLGLIVLGFLAMFFIRVDISVRGIGMIKSPTEHNEVKALVSGKVGSVRLKENMHVKAGDILLTIDSEMVAQQSSFTEAQQEEFSNQVKDLEKLAELARLRKFDQRPELVSSLYRQQYTLFQQRVREASARYRTAARAYNRFKYLYKNKVLSAAEYDQAELAYQNVQNELQILYDEQGNQWQTDLTNLKMKVAELRTENSQYRQQKDFYTIRAPLSGTLQEVKGIQRGGALAANEVIATISPDSGLIAETYIMPKDIGLLNAGTHARFLVDAFNYNQWGVLTGKVISVSNDSYNNDGQTFFKVRCRLDHSVLTLKNGYKGHLKKGMTLQAMFYVTRRSLFQLLYDKTDDWLNPNRSDQKSSSKASSE